MRNKLLFVFVFLFLLVALMSGASAAPTAAQGAIYKLTLLHTNDQHGHWEPMVVSEVSQGGIARRATVVKKVRGEVTNVLLLDAGDICQGTLYFVQYKCQERRELYNLVGYEVVTLGNHEFDYGPKNLADNFLTGAKFDVVLANLDVSAEPTLAGKFPPYVIKTVGGEKIGIFGMITDDLPTNSNAGTNVKMKDAVQTAKDMVAELTKQGANKIILLSHRGYPADYALVGKVDGIDVIVGGHSHTLTGDPAKLDKTLGAPQWPYPLALTTPNGGRTLIVQVFEYGRLLGRLDLNFDDKGTVVGWGCDPIFLDKSIADDAPVAQKLTELAKPLADLMKQIIGKTAVDLDGERTSVRAKETNLGNLITDAMLWATARDKTQIAITNGGGIRTSIKAGDISYGTVLETLPFGNRLMAFDLTGADVLAALENGVSQSHDMNLSRGRFPHVSGIKFTADVFKPVGARVSDAQVGNVKDGFKPLDPKATYRVVTNDFMAGGGDGYTAFLKGKNPYGGDVPLDQALMDYLKANPNVAPKVEGRITLLGTPAAAATPTPAVTATPVPPTATEVLPTVAPTVAPTPAPTPTPPPAAGVDSTTLIVVVVIIAIAVGVYLYMRQRKA